jgi:hypothetical protein
MGEEAIVTEFLAQTGWKGTSGIFKWKGAHEQR